MGGKVRMNRPAAHRGKAAMVRWPATLATRGSATSGLCVDVRSLPCGGGASRLRHGAVMGDMVVA
jgi:hypothetical protein